jgi:transcription initiation factor TFIIB
MEGRGAEGKAETERTQQAGEGKGVTSCPGCGSTRLVRDYGRGELICAGCGLVVAEGIMDPGPEWRAYDREQRDRRERAGPPATLTIHDKGLSTAIDWRDRDSFGKDLTPARRIQIYRLRRLQRKARVQDSIDRNLSFALLEIDRMASHLGLPRGVRETAALIYRRAVEGGSIRGRPIEGMAGAALYAACREHGVPRTLDEIAGAAGVSRKRVGRSYRFMARELLIRTRPASPADYVPRFASELGLSGEVQSRAAEILREAAEKGLTSGRSPAGTAAAALYLAARMLGERRSQGEVADAAGVTEVTVRSRCRELREGLGLGLAGDLRAGRPRTRPSAPCKPVKRLG